MTNAELIAKIKAEIERHINELGISDESILLEAELSEILSFISTLESEKSEVDLEKEIEISIRLLNGLHTLEDNKSWYKGRYEELKELARHFYDLGCTRTAEKYDELEYNRQRAEEESVPKDLEEAAKEYTDGKSWAKENYLTPYIREAFIAGAKWQKEHDAELIEIAYNDGITIGMTKQKEQMMEEAVEVNLDFTHQITLPFDDPGFGKKGDKVRIIIVKEDEK